MPTQWTLDLDLTTEVAAGHRYDVLHALACGFFEQGAGDHNAEYKPFAVRLTGPTPAGSKLTLTWLPDQPPATLNMPAVVRLGPHLAEVTGAQLCKVSLNAEGLREAQGRVRIRTHSPVRFRHHGHDYLLPDPHLTYAGLARRLQAFQPAMVDDTAVRELTRSVVVPQHNIRTETFTWHGSRSAGFVGTVTFALLGGCSANVQRLFADLNTFASVAGIGHGTTHGLGAVDIEHLTAARPALTPEASLAGQPA